MWHINLPKTVIYWLVTPQTGICKSTWNKIIPYHFLYLLCKCMGRSWAHKCLVSNFIDIICSKYLNISEKSNMSLPTSDSFCLIKSQITTTGLHWSSILTIGYNIEKKEEKILLFSPLPQSVSKIYTFRKSYFWKLVQGKFNIVISN